MADEAKRQQRTKTIDIVLSCSICQETLSAVYASPYSRHGLQQGPHGNNGLSSDGSITKLWLTECAHITCGKHLGGGGVPFHPENQPPKAPCPYCSINNRDQTAKILYAIRGVSPGQYDDSIPKDYLQVPPPQLGQPGNEALRFQYVSLLRFASKVHERLLASEKELKTWKDRESSIVACLAATEPLGRALQIARNQLLELQGDVSVIDDALHLAASLKGNTALPPARKSVSTTGGSRTVLGEQDSHAGSLLARGSAADLQIIQDDARHPNNHRLSRTDQVHGCEDSQSLKRKRSNTMTDHGLRNPQSPNTTRVIQQPSSKDEMPPPAQLLHNTTWTNPDRQALSRQYRSLGQIPGRHSHNGPTSLEDDFSPSDIGSTRGPMFNGTDNVPEDRSYDVPENMMPAASLSLKEPQIDDGELDRNFRTAPSRLGSRLSGISSSRITLPPSTPSIFNHHTPRRIGLSANVRTSRPPLPTSASSRSPPRKIGYYPPAPSNAPAASPYFSNRALPNSQVSQSPYVDSQSLPVAPPNHRSRSTINAPIHAPAASAPWKLPWLTAPFRQGQRESQSRQGSSAEQLHNGSGAYRQPGGHQHVHDQRPSLNGFSFATQPQIENANGGRSSRTPFASHGRRPARR